MAFKVKLFHGQPDFESLHVAKIIDYPLEKRDYKPYSQCKLCFAPDGFHIQFLSFEAAALAASCMKAVFNFDAQTQEKCFSFSVFSDGRFAAGEGEFETPFTPGHIHFLPAKICRGNIGELPSVFPSWRLPGVIQISALSQALPLKEISISFVRTQAVLITDLILRRISPVLWKRKVS